MAARVAMLKVAFEVSLEPLIEAFRKLSEGVAEATESVLGIPNPYRIQREAHEYRRRQHQLLDQIMRINAGNRRRQMRGRRTAV